MPRFAATTSWAAKFPLNDVEVDIEISRSYTKAIGIHGRANPTLLPDSGRTEVTRQATCIAFAGLGDSTSGSAQHYDASPHNQLGESSNQIGHQGR